jgi:hypothetical protein
MSGFLKRAHDRVRRLEEQFEARKCLVEANAKTKRRRRRRTVAAVLPLNAAAILQQGRR